MKSIEQAVILCGGLGTRLRPLTDSLPKPMVPVNGTPFLQYLLEQLFQNGIRRFVLLTGYLGSAIEDYFSGDGSRFGWNIVYSEGPAEWDTGRRIFEARDQLDDEFLLAYSDNFAEFNLGILQEVHAQGAFDMTLTVAEKSPGNIRLGEKASVLSYERSRSNSQANHVEIGYMIVKRDSIWDHLKDANSSFSTVIESMAEAGLVGGHLNPFRYRSISDPQRLALTEKFLAPSKVLLIDRDGLLNEKAPRGEYVDKWENFRWIPDSVEALKKLSGKGFRFLVISNQAGIGRGMSKRENVEDLHLRMIKELKEQGIYVDRVYICPHHWVDNCFCRKPNPGLFVKANSDFDLRMDQVIYVGDDPRDCQAARNAGCKSLYVGFNDDLSGLQPEEMPIASARSLLDLTDIVEEFYDTHRSAY